MSYYNGPNNLRPLHFKVSSLLRLPISATTNVIFSISIYPCILRLPSISDHILLVESFCEWVVLKCRDHCSANYNFKDLNHINTYTCKFPKTCVTNDMYQWHKVNFKILLNTTNGISAAWNERTYLLNYVKAIKLPVNINISNPSKYCTRITHMVFTASSGPCTTPCTVPCAVFITHPTRFKLWAVCTVYWNMTQLTTCMQDLSIWLRGTNCPV